MTTFSEIFNAPFGEIFSSVFGEVSISGSLTEPIYIDSDIDVEFSELIDPATVTNTGGGATGSFRLYNNDTEAWVDCNDTVTTVDNITFTITPASDLTATESYTVFLSSAITGSATGRTYNDQDFTFTATALLTGDLFNLEFAGNANDDSGNGNNFTVVNATLTNDSDGNPNSAYDFDGSGDKLTGMGTQSFPTEGSIAFKIKPTAWSGTTDNVFANNSGSGGNLKAFRAEEGSSGKIKLVLADDSGNLSAANLASNTALANATVYTVVLTWSVANGRQRIYIAKELDAELEGVVKVPTAFASFAIGAGILAARDLNALLDWTKMWSKELTADEVRGV